MQQWTDEIPAQRVYVLGIRGRQQVMHTVNDYTAQKINSHRVSVAHDSKWYYSSLGPAWVSRWAGLGPASGTGCFQSLSVSSSLEQCHPREVLPVQGRNARGRAHSTAQAPDCVTASHPLGQRRPCVSVHSQWDTEMLSFQREAEQPPGRAVGSGRDGALEQ